MALPSNAMELPKALRDLILSKKCVAFIGSGVSAGCYNSWADLINNLCKRCDCPSEVGHDSPGDALLDAAQDAKDADEQAYYEFLGEHFGERPRSIPRPYVAMLSLPFRCYLTVNFDPLLSLVSCVNRNDGHSRLDVYPSLDRGAMGNGSIHYLHGYIGEGSIPRPGSIVLARSEFDEAYEDNSNLMAFLVATFEHDPIVFVGCRLREPGMSRVFQISIRNQQKRLKLTMQRGPNGSRPPRKFILLSNPEVKNSEGRIDVEQSRIAAEEEDRYFNDMDITPIWYTAPGGDHSVLWSALEQLGNLSRIAPDHGWGGRSYAT